MDEGELGEKITSLIVLITLIQAGYHMENIRLIPTLSGLCL
jgi:hypothetical protein